MCCVQDDGCRGWPVFQALCVKMRRGQAALLVGRGRDDEGREMQVEELLLLCCGFEDDGGNFKFYLDSLTPQPSFSREQGVRTPLFRLFSGEDAEAIRKWLACRRAWDVLR